MLGRNKLRFEQVAPQLVGKKRPYITGNPDLLRQAGPIPGTGLLFETNLSATYLVKISRDLIKMMGYDPSSLEIEYN
jgi:hypothetical protein